MPTPGNNCLRREVTGPHATIARHRGDPETAWELIRPRLPAGPATEPGDSIHQEGLLLLRLAADLCLDSGNLPEARTWLATHDRWLAWSGSVLGQADGKLAWARYHQAAGDTDLAHAAAHEALELAADPPLPLVRLGAHRLLGELATAARAHDAADSHLTTALDLATIGELPFERVLTLLALADLRVATGATEAAAVDLADAHEIGTTLGAAPTLARIDALAARVREYPASGLAPAGLTQREVEVLRLLAHRLSNPEIADRLSVGPRTVQTHVEHILGKLGVANRREAAEAASRLGLV